MGDVLGEGGDDLRDAARRVCRGFLERADRLVRRGEGVHELRLTGWDVGFVAAEDAVDATRV